MATRKKDPTKPKRNSSPAQLANLRPPWKAGECGNPKKIPRKPNRITQLHKELGIHRKNAAFTEEELSTIDNKVMTARLSELQTLAKADEVPAYEKTLAMAAILDMKNGRTGTLEKLRDRQFGAVTQKVDVTSNGESLGRNRSITPEQAKELLARLDEKY